MHFSIPSTSSIHHLASDRLISGSELENEIAKRTFILSSLGIGPRSYVVIAHGGTPEFFADLFAVWRMGACAACVNPGVTGGELYNLVSFTDSSLVLMGDKAADASKLNVKTIDLSIEKKSKILTPLVGSLDDPALILFTSGTTGQPKGVVHNFRSLFARISLNRLYIGDDVLNKTLCVLPTHFGHGLIGNCLTTLFAGGKLILRWRYWP
ncbi:MAG: class I adenylate-forming enzyme family protein [Alphaproteobacteria bacterium]